MALICPMEITAYLNSTEQQTITKVTIGVTLRINMEQPFRTLLIYGKQQLLLGNLTQMLLSSMKPPMVHAASSSPKAVTPLSDVTHLPILIT